MKTHYYGKGVVSLFVLTVMSAPIAAEDWGDKMFDRPKIKFGTVARLADTTFTVTVKNPYAEEIQITSLTTSCGCISWTEQAPISIASRAERVLTIRLDTVRHVGEKRVKAIVGLLEPVKGSTSTVTLPVEGRIRDDFEVRPSSVAFGTVDLGSGYTQRISINYQGHAGWKLSSAKVENAHLTTQIVEKARNNGTIQYDVVVELKPDAPAGTLRDRLILTTNEAGSSEIAIPVEARVENDIVVTDAQFGMVTIGQSKSITVMLRGKKAFEIEKVEQITHEGKEKAALRGNDQPTVSTTIESSTNDLIDTFKTEFASGVTQLHMLTLTMTPPNEAGMFDETFAVTIRGRKLPVTFHTKGRIQDQAVTSLLR
jgi:hypothetical protein